MQALWISAYFDGALSRDLKTLEGRDDAEKDLENEAVLHSRFGKWRYPVGFGARFPDFVFDTVPYLDMLMRDLGLRHWRKGGLLAEMFGGAYGPGDYRGLIEEWEASAQSEKD